MVEVIRPHRRLSNLEKHERQEEEERERQERRRNSTDQEEGDGGSDLRELAHSEPQGGVAATIDLFKSKPILSALLAFVPIGFAAFYLDWAPALIFGTSFLALIPLAGFLGDITEEVAIHTNAAIGALLNASFGNATELIISCIAVKKAINMSKEAATTALGGEDGPGSVEKSGEGAGGESHFNDLVQLTLLGSVLGNMLLVLGSSFLLAGVKRPELTYNKKPVDIYGSLLIISVALLAIPSIFEFIPNKIGGGTATVSRIISLGMIFFYVLYLFFSLRTHRSLFDDDGDDDEEANLPLPIAIVLLAIITLLISFHSDFLVDAVKPTAEQLNLSYMFIAVILIPIVGNVAEHAAAIMLAMKGKMDVAIGIAIGSSIQIALFMIPFMVLVSWVLGGTLTLNFHMFSIVIVFTSVLVVKSIVQDGSSNWFEGSLLVGMYLAVCACYLFVGGEHIV